MAWHWRGIYQCLSGMLRPFCCLGLHSCSRPARALSCAPGVSTLLLQKFMHVPLHVLIVLLCLVFQASCSILEYFSVFSLLPSHSPSLLTSCYYNLFFIITIIILFYIFVILVSVSILVSVLVLVSVSLLVLVSVLVSVLVLVWVSLWVSLLL